MPAFADLCAVDVRSVDGAVRRLAIVQDDPALKAFTEEILASSPPTPSDQLGPTSVFRTGESIWLRTVTPDFYELAPRNERHRRLYPPTRAKVVHLQRGARQRAHHGSTDVRDP